MHHRSGICPSDTDEGQTGSDAIAAKMLPLVEDSQSSAERRGRVFLRHFQCCMSTLSQTGRFFFSVGFAHGLWFEGIAAYVAVRELFELPGTGWSLLATAQSDDFRVSDTILTI